ncbi:hypothetical protein FALBO_6216 [Fusarium albosuccineum]|uniref:Uncharacterized protein n=1 Tax=Fusarium albosuccineum TaxID=1237068 RepID=A0A8H4LDE3_9HYPO|nr:hypothetical protein FALBO_6216 [Fusarium albosuccineum]
MAPIASSTPSIPRTGKPCPSKVYAPNWQEASDVIGTWEGRHLIVDGFSLQATSASRMHHHVGRDPTGRV